MKKRTVWLIVGAVVVVLGGGGGIAAWEYHEQPQFCGTCHIMDTYLESWESPELLAGAHAEAGIECLECHVPTIQQQIEEVVKTITKDYEDPLEQRQFEKEWCFQCHEHGSYAALIERTSDYEYLGVQVINPHAVTIDLSIVESRVSPHETEGDAPECYRCHEMHGESEGESASLTYCFGCHHQEIFVRCSMCH